MRAMIAALSSATALLSLTSVAATCGACACLVMHAWPWNSKLHQHQAHSLPVWQASADSCHFIFKPQWHSR